MSSPRIRAHPRPLILVYYAETHTRMLKRTGLLGYSDELLYPALTERAEGERDIARET